MKLRFCAFLLLLCLSAMMILPAAATSDSLPIAGETDEGPSPEAALLPLALDNRQNTVPILIILGLSVLCMGFGLIRMCTTKKKH